MKKITLEELLEAGCHFGHMKRRWNPAMSKYIYGVRDGVHIFDLAKTKEGLEAACDFVKKVASEGGVILFVGTKRQAADMVKAEAIRVGMPYTSVRWMGGLLTNFSQLSKSIHKLADLKAKKEAGELNKYTKKERLLFDREIVSLGKFFGGVAALSRLTRRNICGGYPSGRSSRAGSGKNADSGCGNRGYQCPAGNCGLFNCRQ